MAPWSDKEECNTDHSLCPQLSDFYDENAALRACLEETEDAKTALRSRLEATEQQVAAMREALEYRRECAECDRCRMSLPCPGSPENVAKPDRRILIDPAEFERLRKVEKAARDWAGRCKAPNSWACDEPCRAFDLCAALGEDA